MKSPSPDSLKLLKDVKLNAIAFAVAAGEGERVYLGSSDFAVSELDLAAAKHEPKELYKHESYVTSVVRTGSTLISGGYDGKLKWWDAEANKLVRTVDAHSKWIRRIALSPDGKRLASVADDMRGKLWDVASGKLLHELKGHGEQTPQGFPSMLYTCAFTPDGTHLATADKVGRILVWDVATGKQAASFEAPVMYTWDKTARLHSIGGIRSAAFSPDGSLLAVGGMGKVGNIDHLEGKTRVEVFDWKAGKQFAEFNGDKFAGLVNQLRWAPDGKWLMGVGGAGEGSIQFWDVAAKKALKADKVPMHVHDAHLSDDAKRLVLAGHNNVVVYSMG